MAAAVAAGHGDSCKMRRQAAGCHNQRLHQDFLPRRPGQRRRGLPQRRRQLFVLRAVAHLRQQQAAQVGAISKNRQQRESHQVTQTNPVRNLAGCGEGFGIVPQVGEVRQRQRPQDEQAQPMFLRARSPDGDHARQQGCDLQDAPHQRLRRGVVRDRCLTLPDEGIPVAGKKQINDGSQQQPDAQRSVKQAWRSPPPRRQRPA